MGSSFLAVACRKKNKNKKNKLRNSQAYGVIWNAIDYLCEKNKRPYSQSGKGNKLNFMVKRCTRDGGNPLELFPVTEVAFYVLICYRCRMMHTRCF